MKKVRTGVLALAALALAGCGAAGAPADRSEAERSLREANAAYDRAIVTADPAALDALLADDYQYVTPEGAVRDKATQIATLTSGRTQVMSAGSEEVAVRWIGDEALVVGRFPARVTMGGRSFALDQRYSALWSRQDGRWRLRHEHASMIAPAR